MSEIVILGAGVVGMTSAYALARKGHAVTIIDAANAPAEAGASFGNGAQLSYSYTDALASPSLVRNLPKYMLGLDPAFQFRPTLSPGFWSWAAAFLANATRAKFEANTIEVLKLAMESRRAFAKIRDLLDFDHRATGKLTLYSSLQAVHSAGALSRLKNAHGAGQVMLSPKEALEREPALARYGHSFAGALWSPFDESGDSQRFCLGLRHLLENQYGVTFSFGTKVRALTKRAGRLVAIRTEKGERACDRAVLSLGVWSRDVAATAGIMLPVWPMQGYSMTIPATAHAPIASITDSARKIVFCRVGDRLRIAGLADIGRSNGQFDPSRFNRLVETAREIFPDAGEYAADKTAWTGFRPMSPDSRPIVGPSKVKGLFLNCGHGSLGWTLSMGTAARLAELFD
ncbi:FAD-dependent oxidoreductase [Rhizobium lusitanum]|uniref:D-amino-acid dehydrogenase n=1 Tax=Rhizobium lusitanum TaxID=293958 RepID=A0A7X0IWU4_9HYPH|nr:FAD-dependent oxidoreductase [Rhizobium lusitanum]MBB6488651.1 D-amino-acid dehydrogenase [Rhizobium lusitanum]